MISSTPRSTAHIAGHPLHPMLVPIPIVCFVGTLLSDVTYAFTVEPQWANISSWFLAIGLAVSVLAVIAGLVDFLSEPRIRALPNAWIHGGGNSLALLLAILNAFVHTHDGYTGVVPVGLTLSGVVVALLIVTGWNGWSMVYRHGVGVRNVGVRVNDAP